MRPKQNTRPKEKVQNLIQFPPRLLLTPIFKTLCFFALSQLTVSQVVFCALTIYIPLEYVTQKNARYMKIIVLHRAGRADKKLRNLVGAVETLTSQIECMDTLGS
jgi:hypothetical protein